MENIKVIANKTIDALLNEGADKAKCVVASKETHEFNVDGGEFSLFRTLFDSELSITAFKDNKRGTIKINRFDDESILEAVKNCINVASSGESDEAWDIAPKQENKVYNEGSPEPNIELLFNRTQELLNNITERHPKILVEQMIILHVKEHNVYSDNSR